MSGREDIVVVGGGPAGASVACLLARGGRVPLLLEREREPRDKICGDFLSWEAQARIAPLGVDLRALGATSIHRVRLVHGRTAVEAALPFEGIGLSRRLLDEVLLRRAEEAGVRILRGAFVREVVPDGPGLRVGARGREPLMAGAVFLATGKHDVPGLSRRMAGATDDFIGFKTYVRLAADQLRALAGTVEIVLFDGGYAGLQCVEGGVATLCLVVRRSEFRAAGHNWRGLESHLRRISPHLEERLGSAAAVLPRPVSIFPLPYGFIHRPAPDDPRGLYRVGDQMAVIPSFTGDGVAIALHSAAAAAQAFLTSGNDAADFHATLRGDIAAQMRLASVLTRFGRTPLGRSALVWACRAYPGVLGALASLTRIPARAIGAVPLQARPPAERQGRMR
jgi:flavin-dependent dehydrogenase